MEKRPREAGCDLGFKLSSRAAIWGVLAMGTSILLASGCKEEKKSRRSATEVVRPKKTPIERPVICINGELGAKKNEVDKRIGPMLTGAGARVVRVNPDNFQQEQENCDALFLTGGADLDPKLYGGSMHPSIKLLDPKRQAFDFEAIRKAEAEKKAVFGECLGMQQLAVAMRGQLIEHIPDITQEVNHRGYHVVTFNEKGEAAFGLGKSEYVHSNHHQIPDPTTIPESVVVGKTEDGLPEAMIVKNRYWGIQWHPKEPTVYKKFVEMVKEKGK